MKKTNLIIGSVLGGALLITGVASACGGLGGDHLGGHRHENKMMKMIDYLDLNKEQRDTVWGIVDEQRSKIRENSDNIIETRKSLRALATADYYDEARVRKLANAIAKMKTEMIVQRIETMSRIRVLLNEDQREKLSKFQDKRFLRSQM